MEQVPQIPEVAPRPSGTPRFARADTLIPAAGAIIGLLLAIALLEYSGAGLVSVRTPLDGFNYSLVSILFLASAFLFVSAMVRARYRSPATGTLSDSCNFLRRCGSALSRSGARTRISIAVVWMTLALAVAFALLLAAAPETFNDLAREGYIIETASAAMSFLSCALFTIIAVRLAGADGARRALLVVPAILFVIYFFVMGMEEVSWFQRVAGFETPALFSGNAQGEVNLHNYNTMQAFNAYFVIAFIFLLLLPFVRDLAGIFRNSRMVDFFVPNIHVLMLGAIAGAFNYKLWGIASVQLGFFVSVFILLFYARRAERNRVLVVGVLIGIIFIQALIALSGGGLDRFQAAGDFRDVSEYREFLTPLAFLAYSVEVLFRTRRRELRQS